jgi:hypothetical protein
MITQLIKTLKDRPLWVFAWGLFTAAITFNVAYEYEFPDIAAYFQNKHEELAKLNAEYTSARSLVQTHRSTTYRLVESLEDFGAIFEKPRSTIADADDLKRKYVEFMIQSRGEITATLSLTKNTGFTDAQLIQLREALLADLMTLDGILERRIVLLRSIKEGPVSYDRLAEELGVVEEQRGVSEAADRDRLISFALDAARTRFNTAVREGKAKETRQRYRSRASVLCWAYIGGFIGALIGKILYERRMKRQRSRERSKANKLDAGDDI